MPKAFDTTANTAGAIQALRAAGYDTVIRYYSLSDWKRIGQPEARALGNAGVHLAAVYQDRQNVAEDFSAAKGATAATNAFTYAHNVMFQPANSTIYFAVDYDAPEHDVTERIMPFFQQIETTFAASSAPDPRHYRVGAYGSGRTCRMLLDRGLVQCTWLAQSTGFAEYQAFLDSNRWNLAQQAATKVGAIAGDPDLVNPHAPDFGSFVPNAALLGPPVAAGDAPADQYAVAASGGLNVRGGPGINFPVRDVLSAGDVVTVLARNGDWAKVDYSGDGMADGYVFFAYLNRLAA